MLRMRSPGGSARRGRMPSFVLLLRRIKATAEALRVHLQPEPRDSQQMPVRARELLERREEPTLPPRKGSEGLSGGPTQPEGDCLMDCTLRINELQSLRITDTQVDGYN